MDIPGMRWNQELGRVRTALALALQLRAKPPTSPALLPSISVLLPLHTVTYGLCHLQSFPPTLISVD